jgi:hypothetical protein
MAISVPVAPGSAQADLDIASSRERERIGSTRYQAGYGGQPAMTRC